MRDMMICFSNRLEGFVDDLVMFANEVDGFSVMIRGRSCIK